MHYIPIKTRLMRPPQDDLFQVLDESLTDVREKDIVIVTSKVVSIHQGRCVLREGADKRALVEEEAEHLIEGHHKYAESPLAIKYGAMFYGAGIDESNSGDYYTLLPEAPYESAKAIWQYFTQKHQLNDIGVIITDSHSQPLRRGCLGISIGVWGFHPVNHHVGKKDLFGKVMRLSSTNVADTISAGAATVSGEVAECTPVVIARDVSNVRFTKQDVRHEILMPPEDDIYYPITRVFYEKD